MFRPSAGGWIGLVISGGFGFPLGSAAAVAVESAAVAGGATTDPIWSLVALACTTALLATISTLPAALGTTALLASIVARFISAHRSVLH